MSFKLDIKNNDRKLAVLVDPDKNKITEELLALIQKVNVLNPAYIFVGGSTVDSDVFSNCIQTIKSATKIPLIIFPGSHQQMHPEADGILFLSLISGRNPDYLIGHHVEAAPHLKKMNLDIVPTGYLLIDGGKNSSVQYVSQTTPIPSDQKNIAVKTALAGEMLGMKLIFMDAGSGAINPVPTQMIEAVKNQISIPLIVGGGIKTTEQVERAFSAGANLVVIGNKIEEDVDFLLELVHLNKVYQSE